MAKIREAWKIESGGAGASRFTVSGENTQAHDVTVEVYTSGGGDMRGEDPGSRASLKISADEWREIVRAVEQRLIQREDPQR